MRIFLPIILLSSFAFANPIHNFVMADNLLGLQAYIKKNPKLAKEQVNEPDENGAYPLHLVAMTDNEAIACLLIQTGALWFHSWQGDTAINTAFKCKTWKISELITNSVCRHNYR